MIERFHAVTINEWMNEYMKTRNNETIKKLMLESKAWMNEWTNEYMNDWMISYSKNDRMNDWTISCRNDDWLNE